MTQYCKKCVFTDIIQWQSQFIQQQITNIAHEWYLEWYKRTLQCFKDIYLVFILKTKQNYKQSLEMNK